MQTDHFCQGKSDFHVIAKDRKRLMKFSQKSAGITH